MINIDSGNGRASKRFSAVIDIALLCVLILAPLSQATLMGEVGSPLSESEVKAAFVLSFIQFVYWGSIPDEENAADLPICALANSDFANDVRKAVAGKMAGSRSISLKLVSNPDPTRCRVLILDAGDYQSARPAINAVRKAPVLTIGNGPGLLQIGGMFELIVQDRRVQFDTNLDAIRLSNLDVSSKLLQLSRNLRKGVNGAFQSWVPPR